MMTETYKRELEATAMRAQTNSILDIMNYAQRTKKKRVCAYARVSTDKDDQTNSYESQCRYFTEYIQQHSDWDFAGIYADGCIKIGLNQKHP